VRHLRHAILRVQATFPDACPGRAQALAADPQEPSRHHTSPNGGAHSGTNSVASSMGLCAPERPLETGGHLGQFADHAERPDQAWDGQQFERWLKLEELAAGQAIELTLEQATLIEKANPCYRERHVESSRPGELLAQDTRSMWGA